MPKTSFLPESGFDRSIFGTENVGHVSRLIFALAKMLIIKYLYMIDSLAQVMLLAIVLNEALVANRGKCRQDA